MVAPSPDYGPWWPRLLGLLLVVAGIVVAGAAGVDLGIVLAVAGGLSTALIIVAVVVRARQHNESLREAALWLLLTEYGRWRLEAPRRNMDGTDSSHPRA